MLLPVRAKEALQDLLMSCALRKVLTPLESAFRVRIWAIFLAPHPIDRQATFDVTALTLYMEKGHFIASQGANLVAGVHTHGKHHNSM
ncbi:MAG TPA: hypothetical protein VGO04_12090 [Ensifer sp.]|uniref:hypothetical protein n=1 Tax=Ensifer sp. TaxID=1872086 RepID=UPI002E121247|nr:hypothetical protein [Ensifer sp.]